MAGLAAAAASKALRTSFSLSPAHLDSTAEGERHSRGVPASAASDSTSIVLPGRRRKGGRKED
jgi:hypothetical protein